MGVYIDMEKPKDCDDCMFNFYSEVDSCPTCYLTKHIVIRKKEENIPTDCPLIEIDLVRCRECKYRYMDKSVWLCLYGLMIKPNGFCNYGERRTDEHTDKRD